MLTKKYIHNHQRSMTESLSFNEDNDTSYEQNNNKDIFDDDTSKLSFKEKMILFNQSKHQKQIVTNDSPTKINRNRLTQVYKLDGN